MNNNYNSLPKVSVITVTYNDLTGLKRTRDSVKNQNYRGVIEHIVIDGGSGLEFQNYLEAQDRVNFQFVSEPDEGTYHAMNKGIQLATGDLYWFINSGDFFCESSSVSQAVDFLDNPKDQWGYGITLLQSPLGIYEELGFPIPYNFKNHALGLEYVPHPSSFIGKNIVDQLGGYSLKISVASDQVFLVRAASISLPVLVPRVLSVFETGGLSSTISLPEAMKQMKKGLEEYSLTGLYSDFFTFFIRLEYRLRAFLKLIINR